MAHFLHLSKGRFINLDKVLLVEEMEKLPGDLKNIGYVSNFISLGYNFSVHQETPPIIVRMSDSDKDGVVILLQEEDAQLFMAYFDQWRQH